MIIRDPAYARARIRQTLERVRALVYPEALAAARLAIAGPVERIGHDEAMRLDHRPARLGEPLGPAWATFWLDVAFELPREWAGHRVDLLLVTSSEATLWRDGVPVQGLVTGGDVSRPDAMLTAEAKPGERIELRVEIACNTLFGAWDEWQGWDREPEKGGYALERCEAARFDPDAWALACDLTVLHDLLEEHERGLDEAWAGVLLAGLNEFCNVFSSRDRATWDPAAAILRRLLTRTNGSEAHEVSAVGHAHIDTAWLWPIAETYRKCIRTFSSQAAYMDRYPEYRFACSQAQQYAWIRDREPDLWRRIVERVERGQWLPIGGTWIEPDCNIPSGESLVRQFLHGQRFFEAELGRRSTVFWNPDVFGYNGQLPQIMRAAGIRSFLTQKLSWNRFNKPAHSTFIWQGIDGSEVVTHFPPADTYNSAATVEELRRSARAFKDHDRSQQSLLLFGHGDGGGGPTPQMLETLRRTRDLQGVPRTTMRDPEEFFERLEADRPELATVVGELYFEFHRGTYTSQARTKRGNRLGERLLHDAELLAAVADRLGLAAYPADALDGAWKLLLLQQFHDIIPGSSIEPVYVDAERDLARVAQEARAVRDAALAAFAGAGGDLVACNTVDAARRTVVQLADGPVLIDAPAYGLGRLAEPAAAVSLVQSEHGFVLSNGVLRAELGRDGTLRSLVHRASGRETLAGPANVLELYDDRPTVFEAWDVDPFHLETRSVCPPASSCEVSSEHPLRVEVAFTRAIGSSSSMRQVVRLDADARRLEFHCTIDWREDRRFLKVLFPVAVSAPRATYEMQFGVVERPTHYSTSFDLAQFEVPAHRFADLGEHGFGVALLSASTYGWSTFGSELRMSLLRSPRWPDPTADIGEHELSYAIFPHEGSWQAAGVTREALLFNAPLLLTAGAAAPQTFLACDDENLIVDTVKRAESDDRLVIRLYEAHGARGTARLRVDLPHGTARSCNALEDPLSELETDADGAFVIAYRPFELITIALDA